MGWSTRWTRDRASQTAGTSYASTYTTIGWAWRSAWEAREEGQDPEVCIMQAVQPDCSTTLCLCLNMAGR